MKWILESHFPISLCQTVTSHGWVNLPPWEWDVHKGELSRIEASNSGELATVVVSQEGRQTFQIHVDIDELDNRSSNKIEKAVRRWLSMDWDPTFAINSVKEFDRNIAEFIHKGGGRFLRCSTFYEDFVKTVCTINTNWASTIRMVSTIVQTLGHGAFPTPQVLANCGEKFLRKEMRLGFRSKVLSELTQQLLGEGILDNEGNLSSSITYENLLKLRGIGPYSASHLMMLELDFSQIPIDSEVGSYCKLQHGIESSDISAFFNAWGDHKFLGYKLSRILSRTNRIE